ncbi:radical SAM protein [Ferrimonas sediminicola]|uniref:S-adenosylmethionine-dependent nucleotide dehydratase n=1 Tax=Ferrimonas sediminicola TaxID=2569538 RepID=A0A4V5NWW3_9GAMM|nr:viperin family antiviral radical SAM protein [Ferrimonas sediminicola]TKB45990.1 radical SAM protein [Ferrimonas sediminicola]
MTKSNVIQPVVNWHLTEACNYHCHYCYAKWQDAPCPRELVKHPAKSTTLLQKLYEYLHPENPDNPFHGTGIFGVPRLNFAGGEPLLHSSKLLDLAHYARDIGFELSAITNGSLLNSRVGSELLLLLGWLGVSIDSLNKETNLGIGRVSRADRILGLVQLEEILATASEKNPKLKLKLNTVVNKLNCNEDLSSLIRSLAPKKWKLLRLLPVVDRTLVISDLQFQRFLHQHKAFSDIICAEDNQDMGYSYLMIDPYGRFFQNRLNDPQGGYVYSSPILEVGVGAAFSEIKFCANRFAKRYQIQFEERKA